MRPVTDTNEIDATVKRSRNYVEWHELACLREESMQPPSRQSEQIRLKGRAQRASILDPLGGDPQLSPPPPPPPNLAPSRTWTSPQISRAASRGRGWRRGHAKSDGAAELPAQRNGIGRGGGGAAAPGSVRQLPLLGNGQRRLLLRRSNGAARKKGCESRWWAGLGAG